MKWTVFYKEGRGWYRVCNDRAEFTARNGAWVYASAPAHRIMRTSTLVGKNVVFK